MEFQAVKESKNPTTFNSTRTKRNFQVLLHVKVLYIFQRLTTPKENLLNVTNDQKGEQIAVCWSYYSLYWIFYLKLNENLQGFSKDSYRLQNDHKSNNQRITQPNKTIIELNLDRKD